MWQEDMMSDVLRTRSLVPWQFEREVPARGELDSVGLLRATGAKSKHVLTASSSLDVPALEEAPQEQLYEGVCVCVCV